MLRRACADASDRMEFLLRRLFGARFDHTSADERRAATVLVWFSVVVLGTGSTAISLPFFFGGGEVVSYCVWAHNLGIGLWVVTLRWTGRVDLAAHHFCGGFALLIFNCIWLSGGLESPFFITTPILILCAFLMGGEKVGRLWGAVGVLTQVGFAVYEKTVGQIPSAIPEQLAAERRLIEPIPVAFGVLVLTFLFARARAHAHAAAQAALQAAERAHRSVRLILDNAGQGFLYLDPAGCVVGEGSRIAADWLGPIEQGQRFAELLRAGSPVKADTFRVGWDQIVDAFMPLELCVDSLPKRAPLRGRQLELAYQPILEEGQLMGMVVIITDISDHVAREQIEHRQHDLMGAFRRINENRRLFFEFVSDTTTLLDALGEAPDNLVELSHLHTLKGNAAVYGLAGFSHTCHGLESAIVERGGPLSADERAELRAAWAEFMNDVQPFLGEAKDETIRLAASTYNEHLEHIEQAVRHEQLALDVRLWCLEPADQRLAVLADYAIALGRRLGKGDITVHCEADGLRLDPAPLQGVWSSLNHVVRNCVDHGLESPEVRRSAGKSEAGQLSLSLRELSGALVLEVTDDGAGIDWDAVANKARAAGLPAATHAQLIDVLFRAGISTRDEVTTTSGRGVGLAAVRAALHAIGGTIEIDSVRGQGTTFRLCFPKGLSTFGRLRSEQRDGGDRRAA